MDQRVLQVQELLRQLAAKYFQRHLPEKPLLTVTRAEVSNDIKHATIFITVFPTEKEDAGLKAARDEMSGFSEYAANNLETKNTPSFTIEIDDRERKRQRIDEISNNLSED